MILILAGWLAYMNAWPNNLAWDDAIFAMGDRLSGVSLVDIRSYFVDDVWAAVGAETGIYRPLLLVSVALDIQLFGEWVAGFHLVNIFLHLLVTLLVYGFVAFLLQACGNALPHSRHVALLAALVFAIHPVHAEVVNSVFNRSEMLASIGIVGGLWWFLKSVDDHPWKAWAMLGVIYLLIMLCRETGVVFPAIVFVFLWVLTPGRWPLRLRKCIAVFWLLLPLGIYFALRAHALDTPMSFEEMAADRSAPVETSLSAPVETNLSPPLETNLSPPVETSVSPPGEIGLPVLGLYFNLKKLLPAVTVWFDAIKIMVWPDPLSTFHRPSETNGTIALASQLALLAFAVIRLMQKRPGLLLGLSFFYLSVLPSSRIVGEQIVLPHLAERYLYTPSVGLTIVLAFALSWLAQRFTIKAAVIPVLAVLMFMTPLTFARNAQWNSTLRLAEADYQNYPESQKLRQALVSSLLVKGDLKKAASICDQHINDSGVHWYLASSCGQAYGSLKRYDMAERAFISATGSKAGQAGAYYSLALMYLHLNRRQEALEHFDLAVSTEKLAFMQEYLEAEKLVRLYPSDRARILEAKTHLEKTVELQPQFYHGRQRLTEINQMLDSLAVSETE